MKQEICGRLCLAFFMILTGAFTAVAQDMNKSYRIYDGKGEEVGLEKIIDAAGDSDVVFLGELHDDPVAHALQFEIFRRSFEKYGGERALRLSLEMFERDVQVVLDEYLEGLITEKHFLASSRPWGNYETDYRPLVEFAREKRLPVIAANAPRRYVNMVSRNGRDSLKGLSDAARGWLPPLPYEKASEAYADKFKALMGGHGSESLIDAQALWDASMAHAIASNFRKREKPLFIHLNGSFHTESRLGTVEHLLKYRPGTRVLVVTMRAEEDFQSFDPERHEDLGDFVVLTDAKLPRSKR